MLAAAFFPVFYFFFLKLNLFPVMPCVLFSLSADWALLIEKCDVIFEAILTPSERYQNIQDNLEYNSVLPFRIILKIFAVNMAYHYGSQKPDVSIFFCIRYKRCMSSSAINEKQASAYVCFSQVALVDVLFQLLLVAMNNCWHFIWQFTMVLVKKNPL